MTTFDGTKYARPSLSQNMTTGKILLSDFQHGWVWGDDHVRDLLFSTSSLEAPRANHHCD